MIERVWPAGVRVVGLTGGIGSGKSTVAAMLRERGAAIVDADAVAREVVEPGTPGLAEVASRFPGVIGPDGRLDRVKLGQQVFSDPSARADLNAILHPKIHARVEDLVRARAAAGHRLVVYDVPLLFENGLEQVLDGAIVVWVPPEVQRARLRARSGLSEAAAQARIDAQLPLEEKRARATWVVDNSGSLDETRAQVARLWEALTPTSGPGT